MYLKKLQHKYKVTAMDVTAITRSELTDQIQHHEWKVVKVPDFFADKDKDRFLGEQGKLFSKFSRQGFNYLQMAKKNKHGLKFDNKILTIPWDYQNHTDSIQFQLQD